MTLASRGSAEVDHPLTTDAARLAELETTIERGLETFIEVGQALMEIRDGKLYRETHRSFDRYCAERWSFTGRRARQLMSAAKIGTTVPISNEAQARAFGERDPKLINEIWDKAEALAREGDCEVTAAIIGEAANDRRREVDKRARAFTMQPSPRGTYRGGTRRVRDIPGAVAAHDRAQAESDEIRLVLGPWTADGRLPEHRRVPESATVAAWRSQLANGNGHSADPLEALVAQLKKLRASYAASAQADFDEAIAALLRARDDRR